MQEANRISQLVQITLIVSSLLIGMLVGRYLLPQEVRVSYISQSELLELEKNRVVMQELEVRELFFAKPSRAIELVEEFRNKESSNVNVILITDSKIYGKKVRSISKEVHEKIIQRLESEISREQ